MRQSRFFYGWVVVAVAFVCLGMAYTVQNSFSIFFVAILDEYGWDRGSTALAFSVFTLVYGLGSPVTGALVDRLGPRVVVPLGAVVLSVGLFACSQVSQPWQLYAAYGLVTAIGVNALGTIVNVTVLSNWFQRQRGIAIGLAASGIGVGMLILVPIMQYIIGTHGWRTAYLSFAALVLVTLPALGIMFHRHRPEDMGLLPDGRTADTPVDDQSRPAVRVVDEEWVAHDWTTTAAASTRRFWLLFASVLSAMVALQVVMVHQAAYLRDQGFDPMLAASAVALVGIFGSLGKICWGTLSDWLGREATYSLGVGCLIVGVVVLGVATDASRPWVVYAYTALFGIGYGVFAPLFPAAAADLFQGRRFASIYGALCVGSGSGSALGSWLGGQVFDLSGGYAVAFAIAGAAASLSIAGFWLAGPRYVRQVPGLATRDAVN
ncbi:MAG: MFS transporter [Chloroflexota bacterium]